MTGPVQLWLRHEVRATEQRAAISPADAAGLVDGGVSVTVEQSPQRCFGTADYEAAGCQIVPAGSWVDAPSEVYVLGLKELPDEPAELRHRHIFFGHAYKDQPGARQLLRRFAAGGGELLDIEYLTDGDGRRLAAFGYWAGYIGAALAVLQARGELTSPLRAGSRAELDRRLRATAGGVSALVIGALGRSGRGACDALTVAGVRPTEWDVEQTRHLDHDAVVAHDVLVNTVLVTRSVPPFLTERELDRPERRLRVVCDVSCDAGSPFNVLPIYDELTSWQRPARRLREPGRTGGSGAALDLIAIDNLPALLPEPASTDFSAELAPQLESLGRADGPWQRCLDRFVRERDAAVGGDAGGS